MTEHDVVIERITALDAAVLAAYGWPADTGDDEVLARLLALSQARTEK